jgi:hypothetical protein
LLIMTHYYPALARAIGRLGTNVGEARRAIYESARAALGRQLLGRDPSDVTHHRLAFEEAVRKVEAENLRIALANPERPKAVPGATARYQSGASSDIADRGSE